jgi:hypothetical protein
MRPTADKHSGLHKESSYEVQCLLRSLISGSNEQHVGFVGVWADTGEVAEVKTISG